MIFFSIPINVKYYQSPWNSTFFQPNKIDSEFPATPCEKVDFSIAIHVIAVYEEKKFWNEKLIEKSI